MEVSTLVAQQKLRGRMCTMAVAAAVFLAVVQGFLAVLVAQVAAILHC
jgi:hypothetical protein